MSLILLPGGLKSSPAYGGRIFEPGYQPKAPLCDVCGVEATFDNPVGVQVSESWHPYGYHDHRHVDARCARCREQGKH